MRSLVIGGAADEAEELQRQAIEEATTTWFTAVDDHGELDFTSGDKCGSLDDAKTQADRWARDVADAGDTEDGVRIVVVHQGEVVHVGSCEETTLAEAILLARTAAVAIRDGHGRFSSLATALSELRFEDEGREADYLAAHAAIEARWLAESEQEHLAWAARLELVRDPEAALSEAVAS